MDGLEQAIENFESLGLKQNLKQEDTVIHYSKLFESCDDIPNSSYGIYASFDSQSGQYDLTLSMASFKPQQVEKIQERFHSEYHSSENSPKKQFEEFFENILNDKKKELGIPDDVDIGFISVDPRFSLRINVSGPEVHQAYETLKSHTGKLGYNL